MSWRIATFEMTDTANSWIEWFKAAHGYEPNLDSPRSFSEKVLYRRLYEHHPLYEQCSNKYRVREYAADVLGRDISVDLYGRFDYLAPADLAPLPNRYVIKTSHGSGFIRIVDDSSTVDPQELALNFNILLDTPCKTAWRYNRLPKERCILIERLLRDSKGNPPLEYKFHCFNGRDGRFEYIIQRRDSKTLQGVYDHALRPLGFRWVHMRSAPVDPVFPKNLDEFVQVAQKLSAPFRYVRVDLYELDGRVYLGELTFIPGGGMRQFVPWIWDYKLGAKWKLAGY